MSRRTADPFKQVTGPSGAWDGATLGRVDYDPTQYLGSARHYLIGRPPYSAELGSVLATELGLDGTGLLLDVGSGPGVLAVQLAGLFDHVTAIEPERLDAPAGQARRSPDRPADERARARSRDGPASG
jgi:hypothetical protein